MIITDNEQIIHTYSYSFGKNAPSMHYETCKY